MKHFSIADIDLAMFSPTYDGGAGTSGVELNTNVTTDADLSAENKTFWDKALIVLAAPELVHDQFAQQRDIPAGSGKTIEFRQFDPLPAVTDPLVEGVTPDGQELSVSAVSATVAQYGGYVTTSDVLDMTALDPVVNEATKLIARQAGETLDAITREVVNAGTNVLYAKGKADTRPTSRSAVGYTSDASNNNLTVDDIKLAVRALKRQDAPKIHGDYVAIIHPDVAFDLMRDSEWLSPKQYVDTADLYNGEIGKLYGVRFVENTRAKVFHAENLAGTARTLLVNHEGGYSGAITSLAFDGGAVAEDALIGRKIQINGVTATVTDNTASTLTFASTNFGAIADNAVIYPGEAGAKGGDVYSTLVIADDAYGTTKVAGGGLQHIVKPLGSGGTSDPLDQRGSVGWKAVKTAKILVQQYLLRIESSATP